MHYYLIPVMVTFLLFHGSAVANSPPYDVVTISGMVPNKYTKVCLFENGGSKEPYKTEYISDYDGEMGEYTIEIEIPYDMKERKDYHVADMRFWGDLNDNDVRDPGEPISQCHFITWVPAAGAVYMQIYKGARHKFETSELTYDYK